MEIGVCINNKIRTKSTVNYIYILVSLKLHIMIKIIILKIKMKENIIMKHIILNILKKVIQRKI